MGSKAQKMREKFVIAQRKESRSLMVGQGGKTSKGCRRSRSLRANGFTTLLIPDQTHTVASTGVKLRAAWAKAIQFVVSTEWRHRRLMKLTHFSSTADKAERRP